jgi:hypothetical protein
MVKTKKWWGMVAVVVLVALSLGMTITKGAKRYSLPFDFYWGNGPYVQTEGPFCALRFSAKDSTFRYVVLTDDDEHYYRFYYDTTTSNPRVFVVYGDEEDPLSQYIKIGGYSYIEVASSWGDGPDYIYSFSDVDDEGIRYYYVTGYYYLDTVADTILNLPPHEDTVISYYRWKDLSLEKCGCDK